MFRLKAIANRLVIGYSPGMKHDGLGAQLQRILAINALGQFWGVKVFHLPIRNIAIHPLDGLSSLNDYQDFINNFNWVIGSNLQTQFNLDEFRSQFCSDMSISSILKTFIFIVVLRKKVFLQVTHSYFFVDAKPEIYKCHLNTLIAQRLKSYSTQKYISSVVIHHRHGVGNLAVQPGQLKPREISSSSYLTPLHEVQKSISFQKVYFFTDAPAQDLIFQPSIDQLDAWKGLPKFDGANLYVSKNSLTELTSHQPFIFEIVRGGNPLNTIAELLSASVLILSRSSFGYVAGLLSENADIWLPFDFWHPALPGWKTYKPE